MSLSDTPSMYRYDAFLSYAHEDEPTVEWLEQVLVKTWIPGKRKPALFRDKTRLDAGHLSERLRLALADSRFLIVCCSPAAAVSRWVNEEIDEFAHSHAVAPQHGTKAILACRVADGVSTLPSALRWVSAEIGDELYLPNLIWALEPPSRKERRNAVREAYSLLARLVDLPDREAVYARVIKRRIISGFTVGAVALAILCLWIWTRTDSYQLRRIAASSESALVSAEEHAGYAWLQQLAYADPPLAIRQASTLQEQSRASALATVALTLSRSRRLGDWKSVAEEATVLGGQIRDPNERAAVFTTLAAGFVSAGDTQGAQVRVKEALTAASQVQDPGTRAEVLRSIGDILPATNNASDAVRLGRQIRDTARDVKDPEGRSRTLCYAAAILFKAHDSEAADIANKAIVEVEHVNSKRRQADAYAQFAIEFSKTGMADVARHAADQALASAMKIPETSSLPTDVISNLRSARSYVLQSTVIPALQQTGASTPIAQVLDIAIGDAKQTERSEERSRLIGYLLPLIVTSKGEASTNSLANEALHAAEEDQDISMKVEAISLLALNAARAHLQSTRQFCARAYELVQIDTDDRARSVALAHIADAYSEMGDFRSARLAADECGNSRDRLSAYQTIVEKYMLKHKSPAGP